MSREREASNSRTTLGVIRHKSLAAGQVVATSLVEQALKELGG